MVRFIAARSESCHAVTRKMSDSLDRPLTLRERFAVRLHSLICDACVDYLKQVTLIRDVIDTELETSEEEFDGLNDEARARISEGLRFPRPDSEGKLLE